jgi:hypothetical protein
MENNPNVGKQTTTGDPETLECEINQTRHLDEPTLDSLVPIYRVEDVMASDLLSCFWYGRRQRTAFFGCGH